ncbi:leucine-rich repeat domain-containing protein [Emticicia sp. 17c]|uniref:leucine-rich repeat domain-containing protein n=1 Tax=Emticicia sp. 17c TaxID=3127704 RepID=UPI00301BAA7B
MKKLFFCLFLASFSVFAQSKVYRTKVFEEKFFSFSAPNRPYPRLGNPLLDNNPNSFIVLDVERRKLIQDFFKFARKSNVRFDKFNETKAIPIEFLVQPNGTIDYMIFGYSTPRSLANQRFTYDDSLNSVNEQTLVNISEKFCQTYKLPANLSQDKYSVGTLLNIGVSPRKSSKMFISTITQAETCDKPDTVKTLQLNNLQLETFPEVVFKFRNLEKLDLSDNFIERVPKKVYKIKHLRFLSLSNNMLDYKRFRVKRNQHLKDLNLQFTGMTRIPRTISKNRQLEVLFLGNNRIEESGKYYFKKMTNLKSLNLYNAGLSKVPANISRLSNLEELDLYYNRIQLLPDEICQMPKLKTLAISNNQIWKLPENICQLSTLQTLYAHHNKLSILPKLPDLKLLHVGSNLFKSFPDEIYALTNLEELDITKNQITDIPTRLVEFKKLQSLFMQGNYFDLLESKKAELTKLVTDLEKKDILVR